VAVHERERPDASQDAAKPRADKPRTPRGLLHLQTAAGNRAVTRLVTVQRHSPGPDTAPASPIGETALRQILQQGVVASAAGPGAAPPTAAPPAAGAGGGAGGGGTGMSLTDIISATTRRLRDIGRAERHVEGAAEEAGREALNQSTYGISGAIDAGVMAVRRAAAMAQIKIDIQAHGSGGTAEAQRYINEVFMSTSLDNLATMAGKTIEFHIIPIGTKLTELAPFTSLAGTTTFDGRLWDNVRGIQMPADEATIRFAVGAEDLGQGDGSGYGPGFVAAHEQGHGLQARGLTAEQLQDITDAYTDRVAAHPVTQATPASDPAQAFWLQPEWYSAANQNEYFASSVAAWFGHPYNSGEAATARYTKAWLRTNDRPMYDVLSSIYGR
jgi:hypothetical protein